MIWKPNKRLHDNVVFVGAVGVVIGFIVTMAQVTMNLVGFENGRPTGSVIKELRAEVRKNKVADDLRDSTAHLHIRELRQLIIDSKNATDNNTAILCFLVKSPLPLCHEVLKVKGLK